MAQILLSQVFSIKIKKQLEKHECSFSDDDERVSKCQYVYSDIGGLKCNDDCKNDVTPADYSFFVLFFKERRTYSSEKIQRR